MEHSYQNDSTVVMIERLFSIDGPFYKSRIVWAGDYADSEEDLQSNLYYLAVEIPYDLDVSWPTHDKTKTYRQIVNHDRKEFVDKNRFKDIHPLPLLTAEGNGRGMGDYKGLNENLVGIWSRHLLSMENNVPDDYTENIIQFEDN